MANIGYARVSTDDQDPALQHDALAAVGCKKVFEDRASGARADRAGLQSALDYVREAMSWSSGSWIVSAVPCHT